MRYYSRRKQNVLMVMVTGIALVLVSLTIEFANHSRNAGWSHLSLGMAAVGLVSGVTAYVVSRYD